jgi:tetratricopeptide (TPR) repeat protein
MTIRRRHRTLWSSFILSCALLFSQDPNATTKLRLAQSFETNGEWERAVSLYEDLYNAEPNNFVYGDGLKRGYVQLKLYPKAIALVRQQLQARPTDLALHASLGGLYYDAGSDLQADSAWTATISLDKKNINIYRFVASQMMERRMYDRTILLYQRSRTEIGNDLPFADELGLLYSYMQQYGAATREFVKTLRASTEQLGSVQARIGSFTIRAAGLREAIDVTTDELKRFPENVPLHLLLAWLAMESHDFDRALHEYETVERLKKSNGAELFGFAQRVQKEKAYAVSAKAYREVYEQFNNPALLPQANYGYALAIEYLSLQSDTSQSGEPLTSTSVSETQPTLRGAMVLYQQVIREYPNNLVAAGSYFRIGLIQSERMNDLDMALESFQRARTIVRGTDLTFQATLKMAELYVAKNQLVEARRELSQIARTFDPAYQEQAYLRLAELDYFEGGFDSALVKLSRTSQNLSADIANDALQLSYFINENKLAAPIALAEFSRADLLTRQRKFSESLAAFQQIVKAYPKAFLVDDCLMKIAGLQVQLKLYGDAIATFHTLADSTEVSILKDKAQFTLAELYEQRIHDAQKAIEAFQALLTKFPNSLYAEESRKRIRRLRGETL